MDRASPVIIDDLVYAHVTAWITCLELRTGKVVWRRNLREEFGIPQIFWKRFESYFCWGLPDNKSWWIRKPICSRFGF